VSVTLSEKPCPRCGCRATRPFKCGCGAVDETVCENCGRYRGLADDVHAEFHGTVRLGVQSFVSYERCELDVPHRHMPTLKEFWRGAPPREAFLKGVLL